MNPSTPPSGRPTAKGLLLQSYNFIWEHEVLTRASAIAFSALTASVPLLAVVLIVLVQLLPDIGSVGADHTGLGVLMLHQLQTTMQSMFPPEAYRVVEEQISRIQNSPPVAFFSITIAVTLWASSGVFRAAISAMNVIYGVVEQRPFWRVWLLSIWMTFVQTVLLIGALLLIIVWPWLIERAGLQGSAWLLSSGLRWVFTYCVTLLSFALMFHIGPNAPQAHRWVTPGAFIGSLLVFATCFGLKLYVQNFSNYDRTYGSLAGVMILLLWFYVNALVFLAACEVNRLCDFACRQCRAERADTP